jgi:hypothetical protein
VTSSRRFIDRADEGNIALEYDEGWKLQHIGLAVSAHFVARYEGIDVFDLAAPELFAMIAKRDGTGEHTYEPNDYVFRGQIISLWEADEQYDRRRNETRPIYGSIGLGNETYLKAIDEITARYRKSAKQGGTDSSGAAPLRA